MKEDGNALVQVVGSTPGSDNRITLSCMWPPSRLRSIRFI
jgi:hypothetical protein